MTELRWAQQHLSISDGEATVKDQGFQDLTALFNALKSSAKQKNLPQGTKLHAHILKRGLLHKDLYVGTALIHMYAKCGTPAKAQAVFHELPAPDVASWNALIAGYAQQGLGIEALNCFAQMLDTGLHPNAVTFVCTLKACGSIGAVEKGKEIHAEVRRQGLLDKDHVLGTALVDMYAKCGVLAKAQEVFDELPARDVAAWTALLAGYAQHGLFDEAVNCFERMQDEGLSPDAVTFACILKAFGNIGATDKGAEIHFEICRHGLLESSKMLGNALVDMYAKFGALTKAQEVFDKLPARDIASWTTLMAGYAQHGLSDEALNCFEEMREEGLSPNTVTFVCVLKACGSIGATEKGEEIHAEVTKQGLLGKSILLGNALVDMYAKCGMLVRAQEVLEELPLRDVVSWTGLMAGYAQLGKTQRVFDTFSKMIGERTGPDKVTLIVLLMACSHAGLVQEGQVYFDNLSTTYGITPTVEHHTCMVDLFSCAGQFDQATSLIEKVPPSDSPSLWLALLGACQKCVNMELGRWAFEHVAQLGLKYDAVYVCMSNIYAAAGMQEEANEVRALRIKNGAWKIPGRCWWTDANKAVHTFTAGDKSHPQSIFINAKLNEIGEKVHQESHSLGLHWVSQAVADYRKEDGHSEKLAIACALINTSEGTPIRITINTRFCSDCHFVTSLISKIETRKIYVKDQNGIHIFEDGNCFCGKCW